MMVGIVDAPGPMKKPARISLERDIVKLNGNLTKWRHDGPGRGPGEYALHPANNAVQVRGDTS
jgi:hypothetical protein